MGEEANQRTTAADEERPRTARRNSRKVPGGFGVDDMDDLSPNKDSYGDSFFTNSETHDQNSRLPSFDPSSLPSLPPPTDSSLLYNVGSDTHMETADEATLERHLNDVESSFIASVSPATVATKTGADDTFLFDGVKSLATATKHQEQDPEVPLGLSTRASSSSLKPLFSPGTPPESYKTPAAMGMDESSADEGTTSALETMSSPTTAAAARSVSRAISMASIGGYETAYDSLDEISKNQSENEEPSFDEATPRKKQGHSTCESSDLEALRYQISVRSLNNFAVDAGNTPGAALTKKESGQRPRYLRSRHTSQHSSISSSVTNTDSQDGSDATLGADYALQSGGAVPAGGASRNSSLGLSRSISLGSMASTIDEFSGIADTNGRAEGTLATLTEEEQNRERKSASEVPPPETPRGHASRSNTSAPTDTIIARHVRNVQVPESLAQEYLNKSRVSSPKRSAHLSPATGRSGKNLTLKEQSSTIERLSKENFDLKLKVMFLSDRLDKLSEEGVKEMISENVELKTGLAVIQRENKALKRKVKDLEKQLNDEYRPSTAVSGTSAGDPSPRSFDQEGAQEREEELLYLRERTEEYVTEIERLKTESITRENEKRNLAEVVRNMGERRGQNLESREEMDVWKDLLEQETSRREQADDDNNQLRDEIFRLKNDTAPISGPPGLSHTTNIYNITKRRQVPPSRPVSEMSERLEDRNGTFSSASTLVEELKRESEQLRHENAELRREVGAQTSMLTSRNKEKERLYQEIEDLKLGQRKGGSVAGDSIFERSASRAHERSLSRTSAGTRQTTIDETEREELENKHSELRDRLNGVKIQNQDLQRELESCMEDFETAVGQKKQGDTLINELQEALEVAENDLVTMQSDRDEALQGQEEAEIMFESLRKEAQEELDGFGAEAEEANAEIERLQNELQDTTENFSALQNEMREMSEAIVRLEDDHENKSKRIQDLERDLDEANRELEQMEKNLVEANGKVNRLSVQQESSQGEIAFLREEQDGDKIKIGDLEAAVRNAERSLQEEQDRIKELESRLNTERDQRDIVAGKEKQEVQRYINDLNREASAAKDDARRLRKNLTSREVEAAEWKQRLMELESNLREALGDLSGTRSSLLTSIAKLQHELENTIRELDSTKSSLVEKDRRIKHRDSLLESHGLESRKLADMLDKERQSHRTTKHQFETFQKTQQHTTRTLTQQESRILELETSRQTDRKKIITLENNFKDRMLERNTLLLTLWTKLSTLCGTEWAHSNKLINNRALPSVETISSMFPGFSKNLLTAVKTIDTLVGDFKPQIRSVERDLWKEYQSLESSLELKTKRLDRLETVARSGIQGVNGDVRAEIFNLRAVNKALKSENSTLRAANEVRAGAYNDAPSPSPSIPTGPRHKSTEKSSRTSTFSRHQSANTVETYDRTLNSRAGSSKADVAFAGGSGAGMQEGYTPDLRWQIRLQELEYKLKAEREARNLDRKSAKQRLEEKDRENAELSRQVERNKTKSEVEAQSVGH